MSEVDLAASFAIAQAKNRGQAEVGPDELLLGCLQAISQFGIAQMGAFTFDLEELGIDWLQHPERAAAKVVYSAAAVAIFDQAARIAKAGGAGAVGIDHMLAAFAGEDSGLTGRLKRSQGINSASWRTAVAQLRAAQRARGGETQESHVRASATRDYLTPEEAADALSIHVQTLRGYVRSGKLPALRLAGERAIRIRRKDLAKVLEPLAPQT